MCVCRSILSTTAHHRVWGLSLAIDLRRSKTEDAPPSLSLHGNVPKAYVYQPEPAEPLFCRFLEFIGTLQNSGFRLVQVHQDSLRGHAIKCRNKQAQPFLCMNFLPCSEVVHHPLQHRWPCHRLIRKLKLYESYPTPHGSSYTP